ncbi:enediyne biosynthesis protein [Catenuloplanes sp. NPDC051500]|uniref:enediyne biosynthesis protein n=1 Tax=Catenuloplanes sp. NPDC051500 TaxID=3363959 RepID=UPI0037B006EF
MTTPPRVDKRDPRYLALRNFALSMSIFNILGYTVLGFEQPWAWPLLALLVGYSAEIAIERVAAWAQHRAPAYSGNGGWGLYTFLLPTHITALAANMLLYSNDMFWPIGFAVLVAVGQKAVLQAPIKGRMRHFMNPSNFGITITLLAFSWVNIAPPYHFTENVPDVIRLGVPIIILTAGTVLNAMLTKKVPLIVGWVGAFVIQALLRHFIWDVALWAALVPMTGVAFILFTNYMITDPGTTPSAPRMQFMFGSSVAMVYGVLMVFNVVYTLFFAVTLVCLARGLFWWGKWFLDRRREADLRPVPSPAAVALPVAH